MVFANPFAAPGEWYRGNLHTHTTESDGGRSPQEMARLYREAGYQFLALTDHMKVTVVENEWPDGFLLLTGVELHGDQSEVGESFHILGFGLTKVAEPPPEITAASAIDWIKQQGGEAVLAHPYWSGLVVSDLLRPSGYLGVEVFNTTCHMAIGKGFSACHWDDLLGRGHRMWGFAVDDSHGGGDLTTAWVLVKARELTRDAVIASLRAGLFYSSYGPEIEDIALAEGVVTARTSPVVEVNFIAQRWAGGHVEAPPGETITGATYRLRGHELYLRVECRDAQGRWAWSNPMFCERESERSR
jgi:hypothetical protein